MTTAASTSRRRVVDGMACLRVCFMNFRTDAGHVEELLRVVRELGDALAG